MSSVPRYVVDDLKCYELHVDEEILFDDWQNLVKGVEYSSDDEMKMQNRKECSSLITLCFLQVGLYLSQVIRKGKKSFRNLTEISNIILQQ